MTEARRWSFKTMRARVAVALVAWLVILAVLGAYAISITLSGGFEQSAVSTMHDRLYKPTVQLVAALQDERQLSMTYVGSRRTEGRADLDRQRAKAVSAATAFRTQATGGDVQDNASDSLKERIDHAVSALDGLDEGRRSIDSGSSNQDATQSLFTGVIAAAFPIYAAMPVNQQPDLGDTFRSVVALQRARETLAQETSLLAGVLAAGRFSGGQRPEFDQLLGAQRLLYQQAAAGLDAKDRASYTKLAQQPAFGQLRALENRVSNRTSQTPSISATDWAAASGPVLSGLRGLESDLASTIPVQGDALARGTYLRAAMIILIGLLVVVVLMAVWLRVAPRHVVTSLNGLKSSALQLADERLPEVVAKLRRGDDVDIETAAPDLEFGPDEFGDVGRAFNAVQHQAVKSAIDEAELRNGIKDVFVNLARRSQSLVQRQLSMLDEMERRTSDPEELERLFVIDHLATRMRRHSEDLIILSGAPPGRRWRQPVSMVDVIRGAVGEVESYARVTILPIQQGALAGRVVADVIHLIAELIENATSFSPPHATVQVSGEWVTNGFVVEIEDRGLGMTEEDRAKYNKRLTQPPEFNLSDTRQLGLFVVGRLAERHGIKVHLGESPYGGTTAVALLPKDLLVAEGGQDATEPARTAVPAAPPAPERLSPQAIGMRVAGPLGASDGAAEPDGRVPSDHGGVAAGAARVPDGPVMGPGDPRAPRFDDSRR